MPQVYIALGGNIDPEQRLREAARLLRSRFLGVRFSPCFASAPVGFEGADFINAAAGLDSDLAVPELVAELHAIEERCGRRRDDPKRAPRAMDLDLLLYGDLIDASPAAVLPRPDLLRHSYMLGPLARLAPTLIHPVAGRSMRDLWEERRLAAPPLRLLPLNLNAV